MPQPGPRSDNRVVMSSSSPAPTGCLNCAAPLAAGQAYCGRCGQKAGSHRLTLHEIGHDLLHAFVHVDRSIFSLVRQLVVRPGGVARDYVEGRRARYYGPFGFLVIVVGLATGAMAIVGFRSFLRVEGGADGIAEFLQRHVNAVILLQVPLLAATCGLLFRRSGTNFAERLVLAAYTSSMRSIAFTLVYVPTWYLWHPSQQAITYFYAPYLAAWFAYFGFAATQFFGGRPWIVWFKGVVAAAIAVAALQGLVILLGSLTFAIGVAK
jgi:hypothetical protein